MRPLLSLCVQAKRCAYGFLLATAFLAQPGCRSPFRDDPLTSAALREQIQTVEPVRLSSYETLAAAAEPEFEFRGSCGGLKAGVQDPHDFP